MSGDILNYKLQSYLAFKKQSIENNKNKELPEFCFMQSFTYNFGFLQCYSIAFTFGFFFHLRSQPTVVLIFMFTFYNANHTFTLSFNLSFGFLWIPFYFYIWLCVFIYSSLFCYVPSSFFFVLFFKCS